MHPAIRKGNVACITGAAYGGIGFAFAKFLLGHGMKVALADISSNYLDKGEKILLESGLDASSFLSVVTDVTSEASCTKLADQVFQKFGQVDLLHCNAGAGIRGSTCWTKPEIWKQTLDVNFYGVLNVSQAFVGRMLENRKTPGLVICTGSKQGITSPPGNAAYNVSKAAVKMYTEQLSHELRNASPFMDAALLVPGWVFSKLTSNNSSAEEGSKKPSGAWTAEETVQYMLERLDKGDFYIICPDNDVTSAMDQARIKWAMDDVVSNRPALSRWHPDYKDEFDAFMKRELA